MTPMKTKLIPAYEPESSNTMRVTPEDIGVLLSKLKPDQLSEALESMMSQVEITSTDEHRKEIGLILYGLGSTNLT